MCKAGGPRCENSNLLILHQRKVQRTEKYKNAGEYEQKRILDKETGRWKSRNKDIVQEHASKRRVFNTRAKNKNISAFRKNNSHSNIYASVNEDDVSTDDLIAENHGLKETLNEDSYDTLKGYSILSYLRVNSYLRKETKAEDYPHEEDSAQRTKNQINLMDDAFSQIPSVDTPHNVLRHIQVPAGWTAKQYVNKYYSDGAVISDPAYVSTTHSPSHVAERFIKDKEKNPEQQQIVLQFHTKEGVSLQDEDPSHGSLQSREKERLLPRNHRMVVIGSSQKEYQYDDTGYSGSRLPTSPKKDSGPQKITTVHLMDEELFKSYSEES